MDENIKIFVKLLTGRFIKLIMKETKSINNLKEKITSLTGIPIACQNIIICPHVKEDSELLYNLLTQNINRCHLITKNHCFIQKEVNIKIEYEDVNKTIKIIIDNWTSIYELKQKIYENEKFPIEKQNILYNDTILEDEKTLYYYGIKDGCILNLKKSENLKKIKIYIKDDDQISFNTFLVSPYEKISNIKNEIIKKEKIKIFDYLNIYYLNKSYKTGEIYEDILFEDNTLYDRFITDEDKLVFSLFNFPKNYNDIKLNLVDISRKSYLVNFKPSDKIYFIREIFCRLTKFKNIKELKCIYKGISLDVNKRIEDYNILNNDSIEIRQFLRG